MPRATVDNVKAILPTGSSLTDPQINAAIAPANIMVNRIAVIDTSLGEEDLTQIEIYLSAHLSALTDISLTITSEPDACGDGAVKYGFVPGKGIMSTTFGQTANLMSNGALEEMSKPKASLISIGCL